MFSSKVHCYFHFLFITKNRNLHNSSPRFAILFILQEGSYIIVPQLQLMSNLNSALYQAHREKCELLQINLLIIKHLSNRIYTLESHPSPKFIVFLICQFPTTRQFSANSTELFHSYGTKANKKLHRTLHSCLIHFLLFISHRLCYLECTAMPHILQGSLILLYSIHGSLALSCGLNTLWLCPALSTALRLSGSQSRLLKLLLIPLTLQLTEDYWPLLKHFLQAT